MPAEFATELAALKEKLVVMASYAEAAVNRAVKALIRRDDDLARRTREEDDLIDGLEVEIDEIALRLLERKPDPLNLRFVTMAMKISNNLERVGDEATTISRRVLELSLEPQLQQAAEIPPMAALAVQMLKDALDAFVHRDPAKARAVIPRDEAVDKMNTRLQTELAALMAHHPVEGARHEPVARDVRRQPDAFALQPIDFFRRTPAVLREQHVAAMREQEQQSADERRPEQAP